METDASDTFTSAIVDDTEDKPLLHVIEPDSKDTVGHVAGGQDFLFNNQADSKDSIFVKTEDISTAVDIDQNEVPCTNFDSKADTKVFCNNTVLNQEQQSPKIPKEENDSDNLSTLMAKTPCVLKRTAKNELITANGGIILNDEPPAKVPNVLPQNTVSNPQGVNGISSGSIYEASKRIQGKQVRQRAPMKKCTKPVQSMMPVGPIIIKQEPRGSVANSRSLIVNSTAQKMGVISLVKSLAPENTGIKQEPGSIVGHNLAPGNIVIKQELGGNGVCAKLSQLTPKPIVVKQEQLPAGFIVTKDENGGLIIKQEPVPVNPVPLPGNPPRGLLVVKSEDGGIVVKQGPVVKQEPNPTKLSHKSWNGIGSCGPANETEQITTTVSVKHRQGLGKLDSSANLVMCIKCKQVFDSMETLNVHLKKTKHGDVKSYLYSNARWRETAHKKKQEILAACNGKAWVCPTPNQLSFGPVIPEDQLPVSVFKCKVCKGIYNNEREFQLHEASNACDHRKRLQESLLQQFENKPLDKSLKPLL